MKDKGWIKLHRKILENIDLVNDQTAFYIFMIFLLRSNPQGKLLISMRDFGREYSLVPSTVLRATQRLEKYGITQHSTQHRKTLITICNWSKYQSNTQHPTQQSRNTGATVTQRPPLSVRIENKNKEGSKYSEDHRGKESQAKERVRAMFKEKSLK